jgi:alpha-ketoglutarate-dependent 2,4-dichlorophenoxyacetate dioxygenase
VRANPVNGRKAFYVASHACEIVGLPTAEGRALIRELIATATQPGAVYTHRWRAGDLVMWDNRCTLHRGRAWDESRYRRVMHRTTVAGEGPTAEDDGSPVAIGDAQESDLRWARAQLSRM